MLVFKVFHFNIACMTDKLSGKHQTEQAPKARARRARRDSPRPVASRSTLMPRALRARCLMLRACPHKCPFTQESVSKITYKITKYAIVTPNKNSCAVSYYVSQNGGCDAGERIYGVQSPPKINFGTQHRTLRFNVEL